MRRVSYLCKECVCIQYYDKNMSTVLIGQFKKSLLVSGHSVFIEWSVKPGGKQL